ncbi:MAG: hypothetical protein ACOYXM_17700 [Actinomycetota bacterium]
MSHLDVLLAAAAADTRQAQLRRVVRQRRIADDPIVLVPFQPGGEAHTLAALGWGDDPNDLHQLVIAQPLNRTQLFQGLEPFIEWFTPRFEAAWDQAEWDDETGRFLVDPTLLPQVLTANPASIAALGRMGRRLSYLPTETSDDPDAPDPVPAELVRFGRSLRWLAGQATASGQSLILDLVTLSQFHWVTVQSIGERAHLGALDAWIDPPAGIDPDDAADLAERLSIGPYAVPSQEHAIADTITAIGETERAGEPTDELAQQLHDLWRARIEPVWERCWRSIDRLRSLEADTVYLPSRVQHDADSYGRQLLWLDGETGGRARTRDTPRQAIWAKKMAEYSQGVLEAQETVTDPLAMVDEILVGRAITGRVVGVDLDHKELRPGNKNATSVPVVTLQCGRRCLVPIGRKLWWTEDCGRVCAVLTAVEHDEDASALVTLKLDKGIRDGGDRLAALAAVGGTACFSTYTTTQFFPSKLPPGDPFTHTEPTLIVEHLEDAGEVA